MSRAVTPVMGRNGCSAEQLCLCAAKYAALLTINGCYVARNTPPVEGAQWTGIVTQIAIEMLESGKVEAVVCVQSQEQDRFAPMPVSSVLAHQLVCCWAGQLGLPWGGQAVVPKQLQEDHLAFLCGTGLPVHLLPEGLLCPGHSP